MLSPSIVTNAALRSAAFHHLVLPERPSGRARARRAQRARRAGGLALPAARPGFERGRERLASAGALLLCPPARGLTGLGLPHLFWTALALTALAAALHLALGWGGPTAIAHPRDPLFW